MLAGQGDPQQSTVAPSKHCDFAEAAWKGVAQCGEAFQRRFVVAAGSTGRGDRGVGAFMVETARGRQRLAPTKWFAPKYKRVALTFDDGPTPLIGRTFLSVRK